ncbi:hypothetical protein BMT54_01715 [Pasteurellaceae bacterium 15-036681]|nr:hypothetical protein BMT54_01715 [Pasteurellaceae bacterium 15-036681]
MAYNVRAADLGGATQGLYIPDHASDIIISEATSCSTLQHIANQKYNIESLGLNCAQTAHYTIINDIEIGDFTGNQWNGEYWEPDDPFRSGQITLCQSVKIHKKFSREEATALCHRWEMVQGGYETAIAGALTRHTERYGYKMIAASAYKHNTGNKAGAMSGNIQLGDTVNPVIIGKNGVNPVTLIELMEQAIHETGVTCSGTSLKLVVNPAIFRHIRGVQSKLGAGGSCLRDNPLITGMVHPILGMEIFSSINMPRYRRPDGKWVDYILMVNENDIAAPISLDYLEWSPDKHDIYLIGNYRFDVAALTSKSIAVAAVVVED